MAESRSLIPFAPWHKPKELQVATGVFVTTTYGSHALAALIHLAWTKVTRRG